MRIVIGTIVVYGIMWMYV